MLLAMEQRQVLHRIFDVDDSTRAVFHIDPARFHQFARLAAPQMQRVLPIPCRAAISETVAMRLHAPAQSFVSGYPSQFDERLSFERRGLSIDAVVIGKLLEWSGPGAGIAVRPEPEVDMKDALSPSFDELDYLSYQRLEQGSGP